MATGGYNPEELDPTELNESKDNDARDWDPSFDIHLKRMDTDTSTSYDNKGYEDTSFGGRDYSKEGARPKTRKKGKYTRLATEDVDGRQK